MCFLRFPEPAFGPKLKNVIVKKVARFLSRADGKSCPNKKNKGGKNAN